MAPMIGFKCPLERTDVDFDHFDTCRVRMGRPAFSPWMARAIAKGAQGDIRHAGLDMTATRCTTCPRQTYIETQFDYYLDPTNAELRMRGTLLHNAAEEYFNPDVWYTEKSDPVYLTFDGVFGGHHVSMKCDALRKDLTELADLKFPMDFSVSYRDKPWSKEKYISQMNMARILLGQQSWALDAGYNEDEVLLTIWDHAIGKKEGARAVDIPHKTEAEVLAMHPGGGEYTQEQIMAIHAYMQEEHRKMTIADTEEARTKIAASLPLVGPQMFGGKKCTEYCDVEPLCSRMVRQFGEPKIEFGGD